MKKMMPSLLISLLALTACGSNGEVADEMRNKNEVPQFTTNKPAGKEQGVVRDDITDQNPNFLNLDKSGDGPNQATDIDKARQVVNDSDEFTPGRITINGDDMWVTVYKKGMLTDKDKIAAESRIHKKLMQALPRYHIEVKVQEDRT